MAQAALENNLMYLGITMNPVHNELLQARLDENVIKSLLQEDHPMYSPELQVALQAVGVNGSAKRESNKKPSQKRKQPRGVPKPRKKTKLAAMTEEDKENHPDDAESGDEGNDDLTEDEEQ